MVATPEIFILDGDCNKPKKEYKLCYLLRTIIKLKVFQNTKIRYVLSSLKVLTTE